MAIPNVSKVSDITISNISDYLRIPETTSDIESFLSTILTTAKDYIKSYTGLDDAGMDAHADLCIAVYVLCQSMYDDRSFYVDKSNLNQVVDSILNLHVTNLLPNS